MNDKNEMASVEKLRQNIHDALVGLASDLRKRDVPLTLISGELLSVAVKMAIYEFGKAEAAAKLHEVAENVLNMDAATEERIRRKAQAIN
jgi:hypothetical protein